MVQSEESSNIRRKLDAFLVDNFELEALGARLAAFNLFRVLRIEKAEIRHSNVLAWLLSPNENHGLGNTFLRRFMSRILLENETLENRLTPAQVELMRFNDVEVLREWHNIDILVRSYSGAWCLLIENKVGSKESAGQLRKYLDLIEREMPSLDLIPVFLTVEGDDPSESGKDAGYISLSHVQVHDLANLIIQQNRQRIPNDAAVFLDHYLAVLRRITMQDDQLIDLCKTIYRKHRDAIDLIVEYGTSSSIMDACEEEVRASIDAEFVVRRSNQVWLLPKDMGEQSPEIELSYWNWLSRPAPVMCWFEYSKNSHKLRAIMEVGPIVNSALRIRLMKHLKSAGFSFKEKGAFREEAKFTRIVTAIKTLELREGGEPKDSPEYIRQLTASLWKILWGEGNKIVDALKCFEWNQSLV